MSDRLFIDPSRLTPATLTPPASKSDGQRALVLAHMLGRLNELPVRDDAPDDVLALHAGLTALGQRGEATVDCGDGGAPFRLLLTQAALRPGVTSLRGSARLGERPHAPLIKALRGALGGAGLRIEEGSPWPLRVEGASRQASEARFVIDGTLSSQFASSLLLGAAYCCQREGRPWSVELTGHGASLGYLALTVRWLEAAGFSIARQGAVLSVTGVAPVHTLPQVPGDWSSLGYLLLIAWRSGGWATGVDVTSQHPDRALVRIAEQAGLSLIQNSEGAALRGVPKRGVVATGDECPDLLPTLAALACVLPEPSTFERVGVLRHKESDRLQGIEQLVAAAGGETHLTDDRLIVVPPATPSARLSLRSEGDHRRAMSAATLAVLTGAQLTLTGASCVKKSFPGFWQQLDRAGVLSTPLDAESAP